MSDFRDQTPEINFHENVLANLTEYLTLLLHSISCKYENQDFILTKEIN